MSMTVPIQSLSNTAATSIPEIRHLQLTLFRLLQVLGFAFKHCALCIARQRLSHVNRENMNLPACQCIKIGNENQRSLQNGRHQIFLELKLRHEPKFELNIRYDFATNNIFSWIYTEMRLNIAFFHQISFPSFRSTLACNNKIRKDKTGNTVK